MLVRINNNNNKYEVNKITGTMRNYNTEVIVLVIFDPPIIDKNVATNLLYNNLLILQKSLK